MNKYIQSVAAFGVAGAIGFIAPAAPGASPIQATSTAKAEPPAVLCMGQENPLDIQLNPEGSFESEGREGLVLQLDVANNTDEPVRALWSAELLDDQGNLLDEPQRSGVVRIGTRGADRSVKLRTRTDLEDGFYQLRIRSAAVGDGGDESAAEITFGFELAGGAVVPLDDNDFAAFSDLNEGA
jgi:hypothetical protein